MKEGTDQDFSISPEVSWGIFCMSLLDQKFMRIALNLAQKGKGKTSPNPMVGAVVVRNAKIVGQGYHRRFGLPHAEVNALKDAKEKAKGATLYINLEPCCYFGKTPPCTDAIVKAGIKRVVCALPDPNPKVKGRGFKKLKEQGIKVDVGILKDEASKLNQAYLKFIRTKFPVLIVSLTQTLDGKLISPFKDSKDFVSGKIKRILENLKSEVDAVLNQNYLEFNQKPGNQFQKSWKIRKGTKELLSLLKKAGQNNITSILVDGGKEDFTYLMKKHLVDKIYYFIFTKIVGKGIEPFGDLGVSKISDSIYLKDREVHRFSNCLLIVSQPVWRKYLKDS
jgi:diaminohydroxyphosphoribosylaminopyrimidine deaminase/5-amino-6-(5-phosphoribosylamino)uracil reductase